MGYSPLLYAKAFGQALADTNGADEHKLIRNFLALIRKHRDTHKRMKILREAEKLLVAKNGGHIVEIQTARPLPESLAKEIRRNFTKQDRVKESVDSRLIAGVRVTVDGEQEYDGSLKRKIERVFI